MSLNRSVERKFNSFSEAAKYIAKEMSKHDSIKILCQFPNCEIEFTHSIPERRKEMSPFFASLYAKNKDSMLQGGTKHDLIYQQKSRDLDETLINNDLKAFNDCIVKEGLKPCNVGILFRSNLISSP